MIELSVINESKGTLPRVPFRVIANDVLKGDAEVSLAFVESKVSKKLNKKLRGKDYPANVLTFPFSKNNGEIIICPTEAKRMAPEFGLSYKKMLTLLFIHGLLHLKGVPHGATMDRLEARLLKRHSR